MAGIYFHIPFCKQACHYCDFHFSTNTSIRHEMMRAMVAELTLRQPYLGGEEVQTVYFGGGTPSMLSAAELDQLFAALYTHYRVSAEAEVTLEANPDDLSGEKLTDLKGLGINRLSIGIQSFHDEVLKYLNRSHDSTSATGSVERARTAGFGNISIDLIYAIPGQTADMWGRDIAQAIRLEPEHVSAYSLTIEKSTVFGNWHNRGKLIAVDDDEAAGRLETLIDSLSGHGYDHYEVSNFGKPGFYSRHNSSYWQRKRYLGIGPSAHSFDGPSRQFNVANNHVYVKALLEGTLPCEREVLSRAEQVNDFLLTTLRTSWGCDLELLKRDFNYDLLAENEQYVAKLLAGGFVEIGRNCLKLTRKGKFVADRIASDLFLTGD